MNIDLDAMVHKKFGYETDDSIFGMHTSLCKSSATAIEKYAHIEKKRSS